MGLRVSGLGFRAWEFTDFYKVSDQGLQRGGSTGLWQHKGSSFF